MKQIPNEVTEWLQASGQGKLLNAVPAAGGCIHQAEVLETANGKSFFLKTNDSAPQDVFFREAEGLQSLRVPGGPVIPEVYLVGEQFLLLEDLRPAPRQQGFWELYGHQLAQLHCQENHRFGFGQDNYLGSSPQANGWMESGIDFYRDRRLVPQIQKAASGGYLTADDQRDCAAVLDKLPDLIPEQPASLIHGDLWRGNLLTDSRGRPALIDPAAHYGWAEADLAMTDLFGRYPADFYASYQDVNPLLAGYRDRFPLYNLYHLLNHLNIFGREYLPGVREILRKFS